MLSTAIVSGEEAGLDGEARTALMKAKYSQIDAIHELATKRGTCLCADLIRYFEKKQAKHRKSLGPRIFEWLFVSRTKPT